jgi:hypothetical protein
MQVNPDFHNLDEVIPFFPLAPAGSRENPLRTGTGKDNDLSLSIG